MKSRFVSFAPALVAALSLAACGGGSSSDASSSAGASSAGASSASAGASSAGTGNSVGGSASGGASNVSGGATSFGGAGGASAGGVSSGAAGSSGGSGGSAGSAGMGGETIPNTKVVMYLPNWNGSFASWATKIDFQKMTHLNLAFGTVNSGTNDWDLGASDSDVQALAKAAHAANVKVLVSVGGADDDIGIITRYQTESNIDPLIANLDAFVTRLDLDGVDVDLERGTDMKSSGNYPEFITKLVAKFRPDGKLVTSALAQYIVEDMGSDATVTQSLNAFDFINLMIYSTNMNTYTSELNWWTGTKGIAKNKLTWGVEFTNNLSVDMAAQLTTASLAYGGVMLWEYTQATEPKLWPAVQGAIAN